MRRLQPALIFAILSLLIFPLAAQEAASEQEEGRSAAGRGPWIVRATLFATRDDVGLEGASSPILPAPGFAYELPLGLELAGIRFSFEPSLDLRGSYYGWSDSLGRPVPLSIETRTALVVSALLGAPVSMAIPLRSAMSLRVLAGPAFDCSIPFVAEDLDGPELEAAREESSRIALFVWGGGRFVHLLAGAEWAIELDSDMALGLSLRTVVPVWRLWTDDSYAGLDRFSLALGLAVYL